MVATEPPASSNRAKTEKCIYQAVANNSERMGPGKQQPLETWKPKADHRLSSRGLLSSVGAVDSAPLPQPHHAPHAHGPAKRPRRNTCRKARSKSAHIATCHAPLHAWQLWLVLGCTTPWYSCVPLLGRIIRRQLAAVADRDPDELPLVVCFVSR